MSLTLKIQKGGELRRLTLSRSEASFRALQEKIASLFALPPSFALKYLDEDGDLITLSTDLELAELLSSPAFSAPSASLRLQVIPLGEAPLPFPASASPSPSPSAERLNEPAPSLEDRAEKEQGEQEEQEEKAGLFKESQKETEKEALNEPQEEPSKVADEEASTGVEKEAPKKEEEQEEERAPALEELFESLSNLGTHVQQLFEENPQIQQDLEKLSEQLSSFLTAAFSEPAASPSNAPSPSSPFEFLFRGFPFPGTPFHHRGPQHHPHHRHPFAASFSSNGAPFPFPAHPGFCGASRRPACAQPSASAASSSSPSPSFGRRCPASSSSFSSSSSPCGSFFQEKRRIIQEKLEELESMGFIDCELNLHLLARFRGDLASVVDELEKINAQFAF